MKLFEFDIHIGDWRVLVQSRDIKNGAVEARHIAENTITYDKFRQDEKIPVSKIADDTIPGSKLVGQIPTEKLVDKSIDGSKLAPGAVTRDKIADEAVDDLNALYVEMRGELEQEISGEFLRQNQSINNKLTQQTAAIYSRQAAIEHEQASQRQLINSEFSEQDEKMDNMQATINEKQLELGAVETDDEPTPNSGNHLTSGTIAASYGHYLENSEFFEVSVDNENKIIKGTRRDGTVFVNTDLDVENRVRIGGSQIIPFTSPEFIEVKTDSEGKIIEGIDLLGKKYLPQPSNQDEILQQQINGIVPKSTYSYKISRNNVFKKLEIQYPEKAENSNNTYIASKTDSEGRLIWGIRKSDGKLVLPFGFVLDDMVVEYNGVDCAINVREENGVKYLILE